MLMDPLHKLIIFALFQYGVSPKWIHLIEMYYSGIFSKSFSQEAPNTFKLTPIVKLYFKIF